MTDPDRVAAVKQVVKNVADALRMPGSSASRREHLLALSRLDGDAMKHYNPADQEEYWIVAQALRQPLPRVQADRARHQPAPMKGDRP